LAGRVARPYDLHTTSLGTEHDPVTDFVIFPPVENDKVAVETRLRRTNPWGELYRIFGMTRVVRISLNMR
jgi:hypothetical protein